MQYIGEMENKYGFGDGACYPEGIEMYRDVYVRTLNAFAQKWGSNTRAIPYDRPGSHNAIMLLYTTAAWWNEHYAPLIEPGEQLPGNGYDVNQMPVIENPCTEEAWDDAMDALAEVEFDTGSIDDFLDVEVKVADNFEEFLQTVMSGEKEPSGVIPKNKKRYGLAQVTVLRPTRFDADGYKVDSVKHGAHDQFSSVICLWESPNGWTDESFTEESFTDSDLMLVKKIRNGQEIVVAVPAKGYKEGEVEEYYNGGNFVYSDDVEFREFTGTYGAIPVYDLKHGGYAG